MFEQLSPAAPDKILALMAEFRQDERSDKVDLGVGIYRDADGRTPVLSAVRKAEQRLYDAQDTKAYVGIAGDVGFNAAMIDLALGDALPRERVRGAQTPGGCGALRIIAELLNRARAGANVWLSDPTWPNHKPILAAAGLATRDYPYFDAATGKVKFDEMIAALSAAPAGDIVLLHGCCHNPTGANLTLDEWRALGEVLVARGLFPFIDMAYQGFGDGLIADAAGVRLLAGMVPEMAVAASCSKNFGVYRDRVGCAMLIGEDAARADLAFGQIQSVTRGAYSMPPDHGGAAVRIVLEDAALRADWQAELEGMRTRMLRLREAFAKALRQQTNSDRFDFLAEHRGMFSLLGLNDAEVARLKAEHGIYAVGGSRINVAGLPEDDLDRIAAAIVAVTSAAS